MKRILALLMVMVLSVTAFAGCSEKQEEKSKEESSVSRVTGITVDVTIEDNLIYYANIEVENYGTIVVELDQKQAPLTVKNFVGLAKSGFYDGLTFHRIIKGFMIQGGDPDGDGTGGSDQKIKGEFSSNGWNNTISHVRGVISMARTSENNNTASSQFFITHGSPTYLDGDYAAFGYVLSGMEVVDSICNDAKPLDGNGTIAFSKQPVIKSVTITTAERPAEETSEISEG